jgi:hypothetical protein
VFHVIPYYPRCDERVSVTEMTGVDDESIDKMEASETIEQEEDDPEGVLYIIIPAFQPHRNLFHSRARVIPIIVLSYAISLQYT